MNYGRSMVRCLSFTITITITIAIAALVRPASADVLIVNRSMSASTIVEIYIEEGVVRVELEIGEADIATFRDLLPDEIYRQLGYGDAPLVERLARFFGEGLVLRADGGAPLGGRLVEIGPRDRIRRDQLSGEPLAVAEGEAERVVFAVLDYPLPTRPASLTLQGPVDATGRSAASIGFVVYHRGIALNDFRYLPTQSKILLDWWDAWYSYFEHRPLRRRYGAPISAFLYVDPYEVRVEVVARPIDLQHWVDLGLDRREPIAIEAQEEIKRRVAAFLAEHVAVEIDGAPAKPIFDRINFLRRTLKSSTVIEPPEVLDPLSAMLGTIFAFPTPGLPQEVTLTWDLFAGRIQSIPVAAVDPVGPLRSSLEPDDNVLRWTNVLKKYRIPTVDEIAVDPALREIRLPALTIALALVAVTVLAVGAARRRRVAVLAASALLVVAALAYPIGGVAVNNPLAAPALPTAEQASVILDGVLTNIYRSFDFREEGDIYDRLAVSVAGDKLTEIYLENRRSLVLENQGGAKARLEAVEVLAVDELGEIEPGPGFRGRVEWTVAGRVGHWGHIHSRVNRYRARVTIAPVGAAWKLVELELIDEERLR